MRILAETPESPAIPFLTSATTPPERVAALRAALARVSAGSVYRPVLDGLRIVTIDAADPARYASLLNYEREAAELGDPELV